MATLDVVIVTTWAMSVQLRDYDSVTRPIRTRSFASDEERSNSRDGGEPSHSQCHVVDNGLKTQNSGGIRQRSENRSKQRETMFWDGSDTVSIAFYRASLWNVSHA